MELIGQVDESAAHAADLIEARAFALACKFRFGRLLALVSDEWIEQIPRVIDDLERSYRLDPFNPRRLYRAAAFLLQIHQYRSCRNAAERGLELLPESQSFRIILAQVEEYGPPDARSEVNRAARYYTEAAALPPDDLALEGAFPAMDGDTRTPRPTTPRWVTIPLTIAGTFRA